MLPALLHVFSIGSLIAAFSCAILIAVDETRRPQPMWIMNLVWPLTALFGGPLWLWGYGRFGRTPLKDAHPSKHSPIQEKPFSIMVAEASSHCGSGCTLGDICAEWLAFAFPAIAVSFGWHSWFQEKMYAVWILDYLFAYAFGIVFQYFTIAPMRKLGIADGLWAAVKADTLSLTAWQIGMYGFMALASFWVFPNFFEVKLVVNSFEFWFVMQLAMLCGFVTSYPVNWWLLRAGIKEKM